jgi:ethanolamine utilization protein EutP (predicted NTPase)
MQTRPFCCHETSSSNHLVTRRHIAEEQRLQLHRCESLEAHITCLNIYTLGIKDTNTVVQISDFLETAVKI